MKHILTTIGLTLIFLINANATTWFPEDKECPLCHKKNTYYLIGSYGSYIYQWPEKYQYFFWPLTDTQCLYTCLDCKFSAFMWDFDDLPGNKYDTLNSYLSTIKFEQKYKSYTDIPMPLKLEIAENIYKILWRDQEFWCRFYRVMGYHYDLVQNKTKALEARKSALNIAKEMLVDPVLEGQQKETLFIMAAMHNFTGQKDSALYYLDESSKYTYTNSAMEEENVKGLDEYITELIGLYKNYIQTGKE